jgi:hypothetical protein
MAEFTVYKSYQLQTSLDPDAIWARLEPDVDRLVHGRVTIPFATTKPYEGERTETGFVIKGLHHKSQYVTPLTHVRLESNAEGTTLHVQVQRTGMSKPRLPLLALVVAAGVAVGGFAGGVPQLAFVSPMFCLGGFAMWGLANVRLAGRFAQDKSFLESKLGEA